jgi:hypothetical protein
MFHFLWDRNSLKTRKWSPSTRISCDCKLCTISRNCKLSCRIQPFRCLENSMAVKMWQSTSLRMALLCYPAGIKMQLAVSRRMNPGLESMNIPRSFQYLRTVAPCIPVRVGISCDSIENMGDSDNIDTRRTWALLRMSWYIINFYTPGSI